MAGRFVSILPLFLDQSNSLVGFQITLGWMVATWVLGPLFVIWFGWPSWGWANLAVNMINVIALWRLSRYVGFDWFSTLRVPLLLMLVIGAVSSIASSFAPWPVALGASLIVAVALVAISYGPWIKEAGKLLHGAS